MHSIRAGIVLGVLVGVWIFVMGVTGWYKHPLLLFAFFLVVPIQIGVIIWALGKTAATQGYGPQVRDGILLSLVGSVFVFLSSMLFTTVAFPKYFEELRSMQEQMLRQAGKGEAEIRAMLDLAAQGMTPFAQAMNGVIATILTGVVFSLIVAAIARKKPSAGTGAALALLLGMLFAVPAASAAEDRCVACHRKITPGVVADWEISKHKAMGVECSACHGEGHISAKDFDKVQTISAETCGECHERQLGQFSKGKHALAWASYKAMPTTHALPMALGPGMKGCGGCHKVGIKSAGEVLDLKRQGSTFGHASCDACHTRHTFSVKEAREPQACQTCHMGFDHPQWEMWSSSKHGVRYLLKQNGTLPAETPAPACQTCHMPKGNHEVRTPWGFLAVRLPLSEDPKWKADQVTILQALGVLDAAGNPTPRLDVVKGADVCRLTQESFDAERAKLVAVCGDCHSENFAKGELAKGDSMIREADRMLAEAIRVVAGLYRDGVLAKPASYASAFPDLLTFHDAPTVIEQRLFQMHLEHRMRAFQGAFHANPDYALWYGWSEMVRDLSEIKEMAEEMRARRK